MIKKKTFINFIENLKKLSESGLTRTAFAEMNDLPGGAGYFSQYYTKAKEGYLGGRLNDEDINEMCMYFSKIDSRYPSDLDSWKTKELSDNTIYIDMETVGLDVAIDPEHYQRLVEYNLQDPAVQEIINQPVQGQLFVDEEADDERNKIEYIRDEDGKIQFYQFRVAIKDKAPLSGRFTRDEMNKIYRMYSYYGQSITQREISREFPEFSLIDFKRILRAFSITKAVIPFAPHIIEEHSKEEILLMQSRERENDIARTLDKERDKDNEKLIRKLMKENQDLKRNMITIETSDLINAKERIKVSYESNNPADIVVYLSDMHIGASVSDMSIYCNHYDEDEVIRRLSKLLDEIEAQAHRYGGFRRIVITNLGDSLDGYNAQTTRGGHGLPQNMNNKEQLQVFIRAMVWFFEELEKIPHDSLEYYCVGESNHDGDFGYAANVALSAILTGRGIESLVYDRFIGTLEVGNKTLVLCHGKDNKDMFKNLPLTLDIKTENFINEYLDNIGVFDNTIFVKGDLHQSATTYGRRFTYKSVGSLFGSSEWIHKNFGNTPAACDYSIFINEGDQILDGRVVLQ